MDSDSATNVYSEAKSEYMMQLCSYLTPAYFQFYLNLLERAKEDVKSEPRKYLWQFQNLLAEIEDWNMERVNREVQEIITTVGRSGCDFLEDLLTAVILAHTKVLTAIRISRKHKNVQLTVPKIERFLFKVFCECSRLLWQSAYLFRDNVGSMEKQLNYKQVHSQIEAGIKSAIRALVPVKSLLKDCISLDESDSSSSSDSESDDDALARQSLAQSPSPQPLVCGEVPLKEEPKEPETIEPVVESVTAEEPTSDEKTITELPHVKGQVSVTKNEEVAQSEAPQPDNDTNTQNIIVVDDQPRRNVSFNEYETIFDLDGEEGHKMQPTSFHERQDEISDDDDEDQESLQILDEVGVPLDADDFITSDEATEGTIGFDDYETMD
jgi:hypothetical protein